MSVQRLPSLVIALLVTGSGCLAVDETQDDGDAPMWSVPEWRTGDWWQYAGSDGITYTHSVEARETKQGFDVYRVGVSLSMPDETGATRHLYWFEVTSLGYVAVTKGDLTYSADCVHEPWFPLTDRIDWRCTVTGSHASGGNTDRFAINFTKLPAGWETVTVPAGTFRTFKLSLVDNDEPHMAGSAWYSELVRNLVLKDDGDLIFRLEAWGTNAPNA